MAAIQAGRSGVGYLAAAGDFSISPVGPAVGFGMAVVIVYEHRFRR